MDIYTAIDLPYIRKTLETRIRRGDIGILATDTIYGLSGNAFNPDVVERIQRVKNRSNPPSFIPHSPEWVKLLVDPDQHELFQETIGEHAGQYTTLWRFSGRKKMIPPTLHSTGLIGIRFPDHWITGFSRKIGIPLVTTSVNRHREPYMTTLEDLDSSIRESIDFIVYEGPLYGPPSVIVHCQDGLPFNYEERS